MKSCPNCNRTFEDTFTFCLIDGSILSAPFDPAAPKERPPSRDAAPPATEVISAAPELPRTSAATPRDLQSTIAAPFQQQPMQQPAQPFPPAATAQPRPALNVVRWMFVLRGVVAMLFGILLLLWGAPDVVPLFLINASSVITGLCTIVAGAKLQSNYKRGWLVVASGVGRVLVVFPLPIFILMLIPAGALELAAAIRLRKHVSSTAFLALAGILSMLFLPLMLFTPRGSSPFALLGALMIIFGALSLAFGLTMRRLEKAR